MIRQPLNNLLHYAYRIHPGIVNFMLGVAYPFHFHRLRDLPGLCYVLFRDWLNQSNNNGEFPQIEQALRRPDGLLAVGGSLSPTRLIAAYRNGIYPWRHLGPIKWWAPSERMVLFLDEAHLSKTLRRTIRLRTYRITFDSSFTEVIRGCAEPRPGKLPLTWISPKIINAYSQLHAAGFAHSAEAWDTDGQLAGGVYGVAIGGIFFTESLFARKGDASKVAFATLNRHLQEWGFRLNDCKAYTEHHASQGARLIKRAEFMHHLVELRDLPNPLSPWVVDESLDVASWNPARTIAKDNVENGTTNEVHLSAVKLQV